MYRFSFFLRRSTLDPEYALQRSVTSKNIKFDVPPWLCGLFMTLETKERSSPFIHSLISFFHQYTSTEINFIVFGIIFLIHKSRSAEARYFNCHNLELVTRPLKAVNWDPFKFLSDFGFLGSSFLQSRP